MKTLDNQFGYWDSVSSSKTFTHPVDIDRFHSVVPLKANILDFGCGYGRTNHWQGNAAIASAVFRVSAATAKTLLPCRSLNGDVTAPHFHASNYMKSYVKTLIDMV